MKEIIASIVATYTGRKVSAVDIVEDPIVAGTYAIRAYFGELQRDYVDFLLCMHVGDVTEDDLEEVDFVMWPPPSAGRPTRFHIES
jgi:hypothetical protein